MTLQAIGTSGERHANRSASAMTIVPWDSRRNAGDIPPSPDLFTSQTWLSIVQETYDFPFIVVTDASSGSCLPIALVDDQAGRRMICVPFSDYAAPAVDSATVRQLLDRAADSFSEYRQTISGTSTDRNDWEAQGWVREREAVGHRLIVTSEKEMWDRLSQGFRNQVRQGVRRNVTVERVTELDAVDRFYALHAIVRNGKFSSIPQPRAFFHKVHEHTIAKGAGFLLEARADTSLVASCVVLQHERTLYYKFSASSLAAYELRANNVMLWELLRGAADGGFDIVDLGRSGLSDSYAGLRHFKEGLGAETFPIHTYARPPLAPASDRPADQVEFRQLVQEICAQVAERNPSVAVNERISSQLYRFFA